MYDRRIVNINFALDDAMNLTNSKSFEIVIAGPFWLINHSRRQWTVDYMLLLTNMLSLL